MNTSEDKLSEYRKKLTADFPELQIQTLEMIGSGWHHDAIEVNGNIIFRMPRNDHESDITSTSVGYETAVLKLLQGKLQVELPNPLYIAADLSYFGYPKLPGVLLAEVWDDLPEAKKDGIIAAWVDIIVSIHHTVSLAKAHELKMPLFAEPGSDVGETAKKVFELSDLDDVIYDFAKKTLAAADHIDIEKAQNTVIHNDLHFSNMLVGSGSHELTGVIDWTDICIGPIPRDFSVWEWRHDGSLEKAVALYKAKTGKDIDIQQARLWKHIETVSDLVEATESGDTKKVSECIEHIKQWSDM